MLKTSTKLVAAAVVCALSLGAFGCSTSCSTSCSTTDENGTTTTTTENGQTTTETTETTEAK